MTPIEECDTAMLLICGLELVADENEDQGLVCACKLVLGGLLDYRRTLPKQRTSSENGAPSCTDSPSAPAAWPRPSSA